MGLLMITNRKWHVRHVTEAKGRYLDAHRRPCSWRATALGSSGSRQTSLLSPTPGKHIEEKPEQYEIRPLFLNIRSLLPILSVPIYRVAFIVK